MVCRESMLCKWTKYGNLTDMKGVLAALCEFTISFFKKYALLTIQWLDRVKLHYISLTGMLVWTHLWRGGGGLKWQHWQDIFCFINGNQLHDM